MLKLLENRVGLPQLCREHSFSTYFKLPKKLTVVIPFSYLFSDTLTILYLSGGKKY